MPASSLMQHARDQWERQPPVGREKLYTFAKSLEAQCGPTTNLYVCDLLPDSPLLYGLDPLAENVDMKGLRSTFGAYADQEYVRRDIIPYYLAAKETGEASRHSMKSRVQDYFAVYDRLLLPVTDHGRIRWAVSLTTTHSLTPVDEKPPLTERQQDIIELLATGLSSKEIALRLRISPRTIEHQVEAIRRKLKARNVAHAVAIVVGRTILGADG